MASVRVCDFCKKIVTGEDREFKTPEGFVVNAIRLGHWDQRKKEWVSIASGYDLCSECGSRFYDMVCGGDSNIVMRKKTTPTKVYAAKRDQDNKAPEEKKADDLEAEQHNFAQSLKEEGDGSNN